MRKRFIGPQAEAGAHAAEGWLDLEPLAQVEITSEAPEHPIEAALRAAGTGWRAAGPGPQIVRLIFDRPLLIRRVRLAFEEQTYQRTQEFALRWSDDGGRTYRDVLRQQYSFSPPGTTSQVEDYRVELAGVTALALEIFPDLGGGPAPASLAALQLA